MYMYASMCVYIYIYVLYIVIDLLCIKENTRDSCVREGPLGARLSAGCVHRKTAVSTAPTREMSRKRIVFGRPVGSGVYANGKQAKTHKRKVDVCIMKLYEVYVLTHIYIYIYILR